ncbi:Predicted transcriptional regulator [Yokenella regensburgei]|nr:Predicted transcriptional regulator [Yokenella regensburgei]
MNKLTQYDPALALVNDEEAAAFMADAFETGDTAYIARALGVVARAKGMTKIAAQTGLSASSFIDHLVRKVTQRSKRLSP